MGAQLAVVEVGGVVGHLPQLGQGVGHDDDGAPVAAELGELLSALVLEGGVAHGQDLVDKHDLGLGVDGHGEAQAHVHARGVVLHGLVDEVLHAGEVDDLVELGVDLPPGHAQDGAVEVDVVAPGELGVEAGADLEHGGDAAVAGDGAGVGHEDPRQALEQGGLARAVVAHEGEGGALGDVQVDALEGLELGVP